MASNMAGYLRGKTLVKWISDKTKTLPKLHTSGKLRGKLQNQINPDLWPDFVCSPSNPTFDPFLKSTNLQAEPFRQLGTQVVFWAPHIFFNHSLANNKPPCPKCKQSDYVKCQGWSKQPRRLCGLGRKYYIEGYEYFCLNCSPGKLAQ
jgi:hypothetical protein